ncbi:MAG: choice-of-anchor J domain-containing protein, partial [Lachnospiraceae bacterium]|nr:choice-of-anchor J domain-containing protein [Lachnospiraceae bacterium]
MIRKRKKQGRNQKSGYLFVLPYALLFVIFILTPVVIAIGLSFTSFNAIERPRFVGFLNYINLITSDDTFMKFVLPNTTEPLTFTWWERTNPSYPDHYSVVLSTTTNDTAAFTTVVRPYDTAAGDWTIQTVDLSAYAGQSIYVAFHHVDYDANYLLIDDIALSQGGYVPPAPDTLTVTLAVNNAAMGTTVP